MQTHFDQIAAQTEISEVLRYSRRAFFEHGAISMSYHVIPLFKESDGTATAVYSDGYSRQWLDLYETAGFRANDPIPARVMRHGSMMTWLDAMRSAPNTDAQENYMKTGGRHGLIHGVGFPLFGPGGRNAYASVDFGKPITEVDPEALGTVRSIAQAGHQRICVLLDEDVDRPALSAREIEVLEWVARGKSTSSIATILELSPDTVKTYSKRIYAKLDVTDRVGAVVKALRMGLVEV
ncbi:MAG: LuxR C-terminal-related transcriptional regulator [Erythrobacter sp.]|uniref:helix-turn-helix transcriptional regulator n=1 Tax=Erythrobacter sp. TaxID=1042 RepID=UPI003263B5EB